MTMETDFDPISQTICQGGVGHIWQHIFCSVKPNASWCTKDKYVTGKYVISAGGVNMFAEVMQ